MTDEPINHPTDDPTDEQASRSMITDDDLLDLLGRAIDAADPVPDRVLDGARAAFTWRTIDTELAELVFDSTQELAGVRAAEANRQVTFRAPGVEIEVMVIENGTRPSGRSARSTGSAHRATRRGRHGAFRGVRPSRAVHVRRARTGTGAPGRVGRGRHAPRPDRVGPVLNPSVTVHSGPVPE